MARYAVVFGLVVVSVAVWVSSASAIESPRTISLLEVGGPNSEQLLGDFSFANPPRGGDQFGFANALYTWKGTERGARVGHDQGVITFITGFGPSFSKKALAQFNAQAWLPGGSLVIGGYGRINPNGPSTYTFPILGGTGIYANARGSLKVRDLRSGNTSLVFHLLP